MQDLLIDNNISRWSKLRGTYTLYKARDRLLQRIKNEDYKEILHFIKIILASKVNY